MNRLAKYREVLWVAILGLGIPFVLSSHAYAYIDPGTGGLVFSALSYILAVGVLVLGFLIRPIKRMIRRLRSVFSQVRNSDSI